MSFLVLCLFKNQVLWDVYVLSTGKQLPTFRKKVVPVSPRSGSLSLNYLAVEMKALI
jgi:hypothetical protein